MPRAATSTLPNARSFASNVLVCHRMRSVDRSCGEARQGKYEEPQSSKVGYAAPDLDVALASRRIRGLRYRPGLCHP